ncbi:cell division protein ZapA [Ichthyobacterium seriolicida]|uniref:Cell division protein ZapA n=1 Tax=Ichthyobacterium seriolicida TaxID=242600 RepID=A0A1J1DXH0_9FLAO|nr:cell division protein ZapA [Ichthyobacterium seriolicida]BAV94551.1 hypothetical protein JBKA6_0538 [Ichthyobacterium seriolicida]
MDKKREINIKISVGSRSYPLRVFIDTEISYREAEKCIKSYVSEIERSYGLEDEHDAIYMTALQLAFRMQRQKTINVDDEVAIKNKLKKILSYFGESK